MSVGVPGSRPTLSQRIATAPAQRFTLDPNDPTVRSQPLHEALAAAGLDQSYFESSPATKRAAAASTKDEPAKEEEGKDDGKQAGSKARARGFLKRLFGA